MKNLHVFLTILLIISCKEQQRTFEEIDFQNPYKFSYEIENEVAKDTTSWKYQMSAQAYANNTDYSNALKHWDLAMNTSEKEQLTKEEIDSINLAYRPANAVQFITEQAKSHKVVIINEAHHNSMHRFFTKALLQNLFEIGYKNIGFETLGNGEYLDSLLMERQYPIQETGYYTKDPQFGDLVRTALKIGFDVFPYEQTSGSNGKPREIEQARNIQKEIKKRPNEKFLIHCGFNHAFEGVHESWEKAMAGRLTEFTGIDPLTIDQVEYSERSKTKFNNPLLNALDIKEPSVLIDQDQEPLKYKIKERWTDLAVFHPKTEFVENRPNWLFKNDNMSVPIELDNIEISYPIMVLAYRKGENLKKAVPIDLIEITEKSDKKNLALGRGEYEIVVTNLKGKASKFDLSVE